MHINTNPSEVCSVKLWELGRFPWSFRCHSVWNRKLVAVRVVALDTSHPMATNMWDCGLRWGRGGRSGLRALHLTLRATRRRALVLVAVGASLARLDCLTAEPSSLGTPSSGFGRFVERRSPSLSGVEGKFARPCLWFNVGLPASSLRASLSSRIVNHHSRFSLSLSLSLSLTLSLSVCLSVSLSLSLPLSVLFPPHYTSLCTQTTVETWNRVGRHGVITTGSSFSRRFQDVCVGVHVLVACSVAETRHLFSFRCFSVLP